jgi:cyclase
MRYRVIPCLLLRGAGLVKTQRFKGAKYVGDPINAVRIFNEKEVDELMFLDIEATVGGSRPNLEMLRNIASECFMPLCYGGGVRDLATIEAILKTGVEKVSLNTALIELPDLVRDAARIHGSSTVVASIDFKRGFFGTPEVHTRAGTRGAGVTPIELARRAEGLGVGEILLNSIDRDGMQEGYDLEVTRQVAEAVKVPVIACGGAGSLAHMHAAIHEAQASAVAAGAFFVFVGRHRAVLITYPTPLDLRRSVFAP